MPTIITTGLDASWTETDESEASTVRVPYTASLLACLDAEDNACPETIRSQVGS